MDNSEDVLRAIHDLIEAAEADGWDRTARRAAILGRGREAYLMLQMVINDDADEKPHEAAP